MSLAFIFSVAYDAGVIIWTSGMKNGGSEWFSAPVYAEMVLEDKGTRQGLLYSHRSPRRVNGGGYGSKEYLPERKFTK